MFHVVKCRKISKKMLAMMLLLLLLLERPSVVVTPHLSLTPGLAGDNKCRDAELKITAENYWR